MITHNEHATSRSPYPFSSVLSAARARDALSAISRCPLYAPTPLVDLPAIADRAAVERVYYKDEAGRFGLGSFKALGGAYAVAVLLCEKLSKTLGRPVDVAELTRGDHRDQTTSITVACATDGNHGRSVAAAAKVFGCACVIYLHVGVSQGREEAIAALGARTVRVMGDYDDSVAACTKASEAQGWQIVSDTSWPGYQTVPAIVMQGYTVMVIETLDQLAATGRPAPTHVFLQGGVGGLAGAVTAHLWEAMGEEAPVVVVVEPEAADCLFQSALAGEARPSSGDLDTLMAGLSCGEVSPIAWQILHAGAEFFMTISDAAAIDGMRLLGSGETGGPPIVAGESATAGLAGLLALPTSGSRTERAGLTSQSRVLLIGTEGATDPALYERLVSAPEKGVIA